MSRVHTGTPNELDGASTAVAVAACRRCGNDAAPDQMGRCPVCRSARKGNTLALRHGLRRSRRPLAATESSQLYQQWSRDIGEPSAAEAALLRRASEADAVCACAFEYLQNSREGWTSRRTQIALTTLAQHAATVIKVATTLGVKRRQRKIDPVEALQHAMRAEDPT